VVDVFGSAAKHPCLTKGDLYISAYEARKSTKFSILLPEPDCQRAHNFFSNAQMNSYMEQIEGFEISAEAILESTGTYKTLESQLDAHVTREHLNELLWGDEPVRTYRLYRVNRFEHSCNATKF